MCKMKFKPDELWSEERVTLGLLEQIGFEHIKTRGCEGVGLWVEQDGRGLGWIRTRTINSTWEWQGREFPDQKTKGQLLATLLGLGVLTWDNFSW